MDKTPRHKGTTRGFSRVATLTQSRIRKASETRGFAQSRLLTHWVEVVGEGIAAIARPVEVSYGRGGLGATLTLLTTGAQAPMLDMQKDAIREKVNACYGYNAIARIRVTQTAPTGFAEGRVEFTPAPRRTAPPEADPEVTAQAAEIATGIDSTELRLALERLASNVLTKSKRNQNT
ncbi:DUF721 domain-containing protein [Marivivens marinus]|uniref:DUF721 domain-containing protein n=1 Tax=Marivivens marinus TaxID=3110173 RepID=UPI003B84970D